MEDKIMNITVYLGANEGREPALKTAVCELGTWIGEHGHTPVSYTHLDVYKRQRLQRGLLRRTGLELR